MKNKSKRQLQIGEQIKRILAEIFMRDNNFSLPGVHITISEADVSADIKNAKIFVNIFGKINDRSILIGELNKKAAVYLRTKLAKQLTTRYVPALFFILDNAIEKGNEMDKILKKESENFDD